VIVRLETPTDYDTIAAVVGAAFADEPVVVDVVTAIRASSEYRPAFSLVAEENGEIVGHVMLSGLPIEGGHALQLSPLAVRPDRQRRGIGSALVEAALAAATDAGERLVCVEGDPRYYSRFGFRPSLELGVEAPTGRPQWAFQAIALADDHPRGRATYPPAFDVVA
jgi:putative acetyltransferase